MNSGRLRKSRKTTDLARPESPLEEQGGSGDRARSCAGGSWYRPHAKGISDADYQLNY